ncbi:MAG: hypothetical protein ACRDF4_05565, partial [Rhabdochlamydiaceae bacterium]
MQKLFGLWFGKTVWDKHIPQWILFLPYELQLHFLAGFAHGDGSAISCYKHGKKYMNVTMSTCSQRLALELLQIIMRLKMDFSTLRHYSGYTASNSGYRIRISGDAAKRLLALMGIVYELPLYRKSGRVLDRHFAYYREVGGVLYYCCPVLKSEREYFKGVVYNLKVADVESYTSNLEAVHNCHVRKTPSKSFQKNNSVSGGNVGHNLFNIMDDRRIEESGVKSLPGFIPERLLRQAYWFTHRPDVTEMTKVYTDENVLKDDPDVKKTATNLAKIIPSGNAQQIEQQLKQEIENHLKGFKRAARKSAVLEAFTQQVLFNKQKGTLVPEDQEKLEQLIPDIKQQIIELEEEEDEDKVFNGMNKLVEKVMKELDIEEDPSKGDEKGIQPDIPSPHGDGVEPSPGGGQGGDTGPE